MSLTLVKKGTTDAFSTSDFSDPVDSDKVSINNAGGPYLSPSIEVEIFADTNSLYQNIQIYDGFFELQCSVDGVVWSNEMPFLQPDIDNSSGAAERTSLWLRAKIGHPPPYTQGDSIQNAIIIDWEKVSTP
jgi:hypothetical protein